MKTQSQGHRLHRLGLFVLVLAISIPLTAKAQTDAQKDAAVRKVLSTFVDVWNRNEMKTSFGKLFTDDADFVVLSGTYLKGRDEIVAHHLKIREGSTATATCSGTR